MLHLSRRAFCCIAIEAATLLVAGCRVLKPDVDLQEVAEKSPFLAPMTGDEHIGLEVFFVHVPLRDEQTAEAIWHEVDEQQFPVEMRNRLAQHGFRVGVGSGGLPQTVQALVDLNGSTSAPDESDSTDTGDAKPMASRQELRLRPGGKGEIVPCPARDSLTYMTLENKELVGKTLHAAQGRLIVRCQSLGDGRVRVGITPQLLHGEVKRRFIGGDGAFRPDISQEKIEFEHLTVTAPLAAGQMIVLGTMVHPLSSLARDFLTDNSSGKPVQKVLVLRLLEQGSGFDGDSGFGTRDSGEDGVIPGDTLDSGDEIPVADAG